MTSAMAAVAHGDNPEIARMQQILARQREAFLRHGAPSYEQRMDTLRRFERHVIARKDDIVAAIRSDFGCKSWHETVLAEIFTTVTNVKYTRKHLKRWMRPQKRHVDMTLQPARARVLYQPKGVIGVIAPWNYPFYLAAVPLTTALAAGNRVVIKPSEVTPATAEAMKTIFAEIFSEDEVAVITGGPDVGNAFAHMKWDHLFFTGSTALGRVIMKAAAENLTPVTLELGGKSPLILGPNYPVEAAVKRIVGGKYFNGGQTCVAPDYVFVPEGKERAFVTAMQQAIAKSYPTIANNNDYTAVVNQRHFGRLRNLVKDARDKGAEVIEINPANESIGDELKKIPPTLLLGVRDDMTIMQEEIFGPLLPVMSYRSLDDAIDYINRHPRPLALYVFDHDKSQSGKVLDRTVSGGACVNETILHVSVDDLPFGGVGDSGIGAYHGYEGFETFSHKKAVLEKGRFNTANLLAPPYDKKVEGLMKMLLK